MLNLESTVQKILGLRMDRNGQMEQTISVGPVQPRKVVHLGRWIDFFGWAEPSRSKSGGIVQ